MIGIRGDKGLDLKLSLHYQKDLFFTLDLGNSVLRGINTSNQFVSYIDLKLFAPVTQEEHTGFNNSNMIVSNNFYLVLNVLYLI